MNCPNCDAPMKSTAKFCENCGSPIPATASAKHAADAVPAPPASPYETKQTGGSHAPTAGTTPYASAASGNPYAQAESNAQASSSDTHRQWRQEQPPAQQPTYAQPVSAQPSYTYAQPAASRMPAPDPAHGKERAPSTAFALAITSLVLGGIGLLTFGLFGFLGIIGLILGIVGMAKRSSYKNAGKYDQHESSTLVIGIAGIITNAIALLLFVAITLFTVYAVSAAEDTGVYDDPASIEQIVEESI